MNRSFQHRKTFLPPGSGSRQPKGMLRHARSIGTGLIVGGLYSTRQPDWLHGIGPWAFALGLLLCLIVALRLERP